MDKIKDYFDQQGMTQREAADQLDMTEEHLSRLLNGKTPVTDGFIGRFIRTFGFDVARIVFDGNGHGQETVEVAG